MAFSSLLSTVILAALLLLNRVIGAPTNVLKTSYSQSVSRQQATNKADCESQPALSCQLQPTKGSKVQGTVTFAGKYQNGICGVWIRAQISSLTKGEHGFHIHTYGDLRRANGNLAGPHFASPGSSSSRIHGFPDTKRRHWGDLGNVRAWGGGNAAYQRFDSIIRISDIVGRSVIVHANPDLGPDYQPSGDSGRRQAHCIIGYANPMLPVES